MKFRRAHSSGRPAHWLLPGAALTLATLAFYPHILLPSRMLADQDAWTYFYPLRAYAAEAIWSGRFPLWNPDTFLGAPFFANPQTALLYPPTALFYILPVAYAYSLSVVLHVGMAAIFSYAFFRRSLGLNRWGSLVGACAFAFGGFASSHLGHINQLAATAWLPAILLAADLSFRRRSVRWAVAGGALLALQLLAGHAQHTYMTLWTVGILLAWRLVTGPSLARDEESDQRLPTSEAPAGGSSGTSAQLRSHVLARRSFAARGMRIVAGPFAWAIAAGLLIGGVGFGLASAQLLPTLELSSQSIRGGGLSYAEATSFSLDPALLARSVLPEYWDTVPGEHVAYLGGVALGFAVVALLAAPIRTVVLGATIAGIGLFLAFGAANPLYTHLFSIVPGLDLFRVPARWLLLYSFGAAMLAAAGVDWILRTNRLLPRGWRAPFVAVALAGAVAFALPFQTAIPRTIVALWAAALAIAGALALVSRRLPAAVVGAAILAATLLDLRFAATGIPQAHAIPSDAVEGREVPAFLQANHSDGRILSVARTEYALADGAAVAARYAGLDDDTLFELNTAIKLDEVMSPNVPLRYGLATVDGYDGGVLPLRNFLEVASLLVPPSELRSDGLLRTRLIAVPEERYLRLFNIDAVIANQVSDVELDGVRYDTATARTLEPGDELQVHLSEPVRASAIALLGSAACEPSAGACPDGADVGRMVLERADGTLDEVPLRVGEAVFAEDHPGPRSAEQPTAGPSREGRMDTSARIPIPKGAPVTSIGWRSIGSTPWTIRAATLEAEDGAKHQLMLVPGLSRILFSVLKLYERDQADRATPLAREAAVRDDEDALEFLRTSAAEELETTVILSPDTADGPLPRASGGAAHFERVESSPERLMYRRIDGDGSGYLVVDDAWFPGWSAEVDGQAVPVLRADVHFKAVWVPPGANAVTLIYAPASVRAGAIASLLTGVVAAALFVWGDGLVRRLRVLTNRLPRLREG